MSTMPSPFPGVDPVLQPHPPAEMPEVLAAGDAMETLSPFVEAQDVDAIIKQLTLDRPLKLWIPNRHLYPNHEFRIINSIPQEIADARNKGYRQVTDPKLIELFTGLVAGTDKDGKAFRPLLYARPKEVGEHVRQQQRRQLQSLYAGMDPKNKEMSGKYTTNVDKRDGTFLERSGTPWNIRVK